MPALPVAIPSYSEVLFLLVGKYKIADVVKRSQSLLIQRSYSYPKCESDDVMIVGRNPFLFRGPIPTNLGPEKEIDENLVAIPSYSEVLFLRL